jgi:hypothetical protein
LGTKGKWKYDIKTVVKVILCDVVDSIILAQNLHQLSAAVEILSNMQVYKDGFFFSRETKITVFLHDVTEWW